MTATAFGSAAAQLTMQFGNDGPESLVWAGREMLIKQQFAAAFQFVSESRATLAAPAKVEGDGARIVRTYDRATVSCAYETRGDRLLLDLEICNTATAVLYQARMTLLRLQFPQRPKGNAWRWGYQVAGSNDGEPMPAIADRGRRGRGGMQR
jgi:hypothetical protein